MAKREVAEIIVDVLEKAGTKHCYGMVGDTRNHVTNAIHRSGIDWVRVPPPYSTFTSTATSW
jgi:pyruvate dehydrogenase (quinone)